MDLTSYRYLNELSDTINKNSLSFDPVVTFEKLLAEYFQVKHVLTTSSCTVAIYITLKSLGVNKSDEIIVPDSTYPATVSPVIHLGAKPIFCDAEKTTGGISPSEVEKKITKHTKGLIITHQHGFSADIKLLLEIAKKYNLFVIEDNARSFGAELNGKKCGTFGIAGCVSFNNMKIISTGGGGAIITDDTSLYEECKLLSGYGNNSSNIFVRAGHNCRMPSLNSIVGVLKMNQIETILSKREENAKNLVSLIKNNQELELPIEIPNVKRVFPVFPLLIKNGSCKEFRSFLKSNNIVTHSSHSIHTEPFFNSTFKMNNNEYPISSMFNRQMTCLNWAEHFDSSKVKLIGNTINEYFS